MAGDVIYLASHRGTGGLAVHWHTAQTPCPYRGRNYAQGHGEGSGRLTRRANPVPLHYSGYLSELAIARASEVPPLPLRAYTKPSETHSST